MSYADKQPTSFNYWHPKYWGIWLGVGIMRLFVLLPCRWQLAIARKIGRYSIRFSPYRRHITEVNLRLCYPHLTAKEQRQLLIRCFESAAMGMVESAMAWWLPDRRLQGQLHYVNYEHFAAVKAQNRPIIFVGAHFTCLEIVGRLFAMDEAFHLMYRAHKNPLFNQIMTQRRSRYIKKIIPRTDVRALFKSLHAHVPVWYTPDQDYGAKYSVFAPFFGIQAATITALSRFVKKTDAIVIAAAYHRRPDYRGYDVVISPPFDNFGQGDEVADAKQINAWLEADLAQFPDQYLWQHRRFKTRPPGEAKVYASKRQYRKVKFKLFNPPEKLNK